MSTSAAIGLSRNSVQPILRAAAALGALMTLGAATVPTWRPLDPRNALVIDTSQGRIVVEMQPAFAPLGVDRIKSLARAHVYDGLLFHRVIYDFVDQTGNPNNRDGGVSTLPNLSPEFHVSLPRSAMDAIATHGTDGMSGFIGTLPFAATPDPARPGFFRTWALYCSGVAGMGRQADPGSANSEIFFMRAPSRALDHDYTPWGKVVVGLDIVRKIAVGEPPAHPDRMVQVRVMADMQPVERPHIDIMDVRSAVFQTMLEHARASHGADFSACDVTVPSRMATR